MLTLTVARYAYEENETRGVIYAGGTFIGYSMENPWKDNQKNVSCIPKGEYRTDIRPAEDSPSRDYDHLILRDVPERTYILWHIGNDATHTEGCILPGYTATPGMVGRSRECFNRIWKLTG